MKLFKGRSYVEYLRDPNFDGAFVGGPPLLSPEQTQRLLEDPEEAANRARAALQKVRKNYQQGNSDSGSI